jgi:hypothetical protein
LSKAVDGLNSSAILEIAAAGRNEESMSDPGKDIVEKMEELTGKLDEISANIGTMLEKFIV